MSQSRLVVVSNRLPLTLTSAENGEWNIKPSSGGLAAAMEPILKKSGGLWIGWTGDDGTLDVAERDKLLAASQTDFSCVPVNFAPGEGQKFYEGYPNETVWPLFHFFPSRMKFDPDAWRAYVQGNELFAETIAAKAKQDDLVWIHDYHLMLLPAMLRRRAKDLKTGFFLHIPFPSSEIFSMLPRGSEVLEGLLGANLIAFHTHRHLHHFRSSLLRLLGVESSINSVEYKGRTVRLETLPIGIAPAELSDLVEHDGATAQRMEELRTRYKGQRILISVDRLDYSKGIPERLRTFRRLIREQKGLRAKVVLIQVAVPSREGIGEYQSLGSEINELVGEVNGEFGTPEWTPIVYLRHPVQKTDLAALYAVADVAWVTPLRDGMNLVAKEYCACKPAADGVLVLSQFAGAAPEMGEALLVNPFDEEQVAAGIVRALEMPEEERADRMSRLRERVIRNDVFRWADRFLDALASAGSGESRALTRDVDADAVVDACKRAGSRTIILDYDGTLTPLAEDATRTAPSEQLLKTLTQLAAVPQNLVAVVSGRTRRDLVRWLGAIPKLVLAAEHGALVRYGESDDWQPMTNAADGLEWMAQVLPILEEFADRLPGSYVERKEYSLVWHYRRAEPEFGRWLAAELTAVLEGLLADTAARPVAGNKIVEVRPVWADKGTFAAQLLSRNQEAAFQLAAGDDTTDEDMFERLSDDAFTIHVGPGNSRARFSVADPAAMLALLDNLTESRPSGSATRA